jgi:hypothetical protein
MEKEGFCGFLNAIISRANPNVISRANPDLMTETTHLRKVEALPPIFSPQPSDVLIHTLDDSGFLCISSHPRNHLRIQRCRLDQLLAEESYPDVGSEVLMMQ